MEVSEQLKRIFGGGISIRSTVPSLASTAQVSKMEDWDCIPGEPCGCAGTVTLTPDEYARESQWPLFGTTAWCKLYASRNAVESYNADVRTNKLSWRRGYTKVFSRARTALLLAVTLSSLNFRIVRDWSFRRRTQNLWGGEAWDFGPEPKQTRQRRTRTIDDREAS